MKRQRGLVVGSAAAGAIALVATAVPAGAAPNPNSPEKLAAAVSAASVYEHLEAFQAIADANDGNRAAGTSGYEASAEYVEAQLRAAGYEPTRQYFDFEYSEILHDELYSTVDGVRTDITHIPMAYSESTPEGGVTGEIATPDNALGCTAADWGSVDPAGKIAVVSRGECAFGEKATVAGELGALAIIVYNNTEGALNGTLGGTIPGSAPAAGVTQEVGAELLALPDGATITYDFQQLVEMRETFNVFAETATGRDDNVVMVGAHLDGAPEGAGINDNGSGSAAILETAIQLANANKVNNKVRFAWWGAEELGLIGSWYYVDDLVENNPAELDNIAIYMNYDMVASPNHIIGVYDADESTYSAAIPPPDGSIAGEKILTDYFDSIGQPWVDTAFSGRSDYQAFITNGIPSTGLFTGADGSKTAEEVALFGGTEGIMYDPNYHTVGDDITNINMEALEIMSKAIAYSTGVLAYDTSMINGKTSAGKSGKPHPGNQGKGQDQGKGGPPAHAGETGKPAHAGVPGPPPHAASHDKAAA